LANFAPGDLEQLDEEIVDRLLDLKFASELLRTLWNRSEPPFPEEILQWLYLLSNQ
jgi:putative transposase